MANARPRTRRVPFVVGRKERLSFGSLSERHLSDGVRRAARRIRSIVLRSSDRPPSLAARAAQIRRPHERLVYDGRCEKSLPGELVLREGQSLNDDLDVDRVRYGGARTRILCRCPRAGFDRRLREPKFLDFVLLEADKGRLRPGPKATILKFLYNTVMMPVVYRMFMRDERNRKGRDPAPSDTALNRR